MATTTTAETLGFQAEVKQLLHLMVHSLYSNKEIFLRELISNASDAADKLRFAAIADEALLEDDPALKIRIEVDKESGTIAIIDNGIGMSRDDVVAQLGTIAKSGTAEFLAGISGDERKDANLIGQFGVGFYSSFIVADRVEVLSRRAGAESSEGTHWASDGQGEFTVEAIERAERGTKVLLHLRDDAKEFADEFRLRSLIRIYSDHIAFPVEMAKATGEDDEASDEPEFETVNAAKALWTRPRSDISDDEYREFYKHIAHDFQEPLLWSHNRVEGKREYTSLLYIPANSPFDLYNRESPRGLKLYVQRVFIMDDAEQFLPLYLRFVRGIVDSNDLSLNVSRELLQQDETVESIRTALTKRVLDLLQKLSSDDEEKYQGFWNEFGRVLKEGPGEDFSNKDKIAKLLRFATTHTGQEKQEQSLTDYVARKQDDQDKIYYVTADNFKAAASSPHLEIFKKKGIEVLLLGDPIDEWLMGHLGEFEGLQLQDVRRGELNLGDDDSGDDDKAETPENDEHAALVERVKTQLDERVADVRVTDRLTDSPACLALGEYDIGSQMRKIMEAAGQTVPDSKPIFEINPQHPLVQKLVDETDEERVGDLIEVVFDQAALAEGRSLDDPGAYVQRLNRLLVELAT